MATGLVWHERYMWHDTAARRGGRSLPAAGSSPTSTPRIRSRSAASRTCSTSPGVTPQLHAIEPRMATVDEICRFHERAYVERIKALSDDNGGDAGGLTPFGPGSFEIALLAAGGVLAAVDAVLDGEVANAYALVRPPGHHALADAGMGFCIFGNVAVAAHHLRSARCARGDRRLGRPSRQRHAERVLRERRRAHDLAAPGRLLPARLRGLPRGQRRGRRAPARTSTSRCRAAVGAGPTSPPSSASSCRRWIASRPTSARRERSRCERDGSARAHADALRRLPRADRADHGGGRAAVRRPARGRARGRLLVGLRAVLRARDRRGSSRASRAGSRIR